MFADNLCSEYGVDVEAKGKRCTEWKLKVGRDNHLLDVLSMSSILASMCGGLLPGQSPSTAAAPVTYVSASAMQREARARRQQDRRDSWRRY